MEIEGVSMIARISSAALSTALLAERGRCFQMEVRLHRFERDAVYVMSMPYKSVARRYQ